MIAAAVLAIGQADAPYDLLIANGTVVDGSGARPRRADVAVRNGLVVKIDRLGSVAARETIDAASAKIFVSDFAGRRRLSSSSFR